MPSLPAPAGGDVQIHGHGIARRITVGGEFGIDRCDARDRGHRTPRAVRIAVVVAAVVLSLIAAGLYESLRQHPSTPSLPVVPAPRRLGLPAYGLDYYEPTGYFTKCGDWSWLYTRCYHPDPASAGAGHASSAGVLASDLLFIRTAHLGRFLRVWLSLDQLMRWNESRGFSGYIPARVRNLDSAVKQFAGQGVKIDLVLFVYSHDSHWVNQFRPQAIDGRHPEMRAGYLTALRLIIRHLTRNPIDAATIKVIDLQTEPYFQLEQYFDNPSTLGAYTACRAPNGGVVTSCVDQRVIHPWLKDLYETARAASRHFLYTESDTGRLLSTNAARQSYWMSMYPVDVYDIHAYDSEPWLGEARWATALHLRKPWFVGEAGCASGDAACTYDGAKAAPVDRWWLANLPRFRAQSVLVESHVTLWSYPYGPHSQTLTPAGLVLECVADPGATACLGSRLH